MRIIRTYADLLALDVRVDDRFPGPPSQAIIGSSCGSALDYSDVESSIRVAGLSNATKQGQEREKERQLHIESESAKFARLEQARFVEDQLRNSNEG